MGTLASHGYFKELHFFERISKHENTYLKSIDFVSYFLLKKEKTHPPENTTPVKVSIWLVHLKIVLLGICDTS